MNKEQALQKLSQLEKETLELRKIIEAPEVTPEKILIDILNKGFEINVTKGYITYYQDNQWIFQQDLKNKILWCYYDKVWDVFKTKFSMNYEQIQALQKKVVGEDLNCKDFTPNSERCKTSTRVGEALNCKDFTPYCID